MCWSNTEPLLDGIIDQPFTWQLQAITLASIYLSVKFYGLYLRVVSQEMLIWKSHI